MTHIGVCFILRGNLIPLGMWYCSGVEALSILGVAGSCQIWHNSRHRRRSCFGYFCLGDERQIQESAIQPWQG